jgi:hypothetical protein
VPEYYDIVTPYVGEDTAKAYAASALCLTDERIWNRTPTHAEVLQLQVYDLKTGDWK